MALRELASAVVVPKPPAAGGTCRRDHPLQAWKRHSAGWAGSGRQRRGWSWHLRILRPRAVGRGGPWGLPRQAIVGSCRFLARHTQHQNPCFGVTRRHQGPVWMRLSDEPKHLRQSPAARRMGQEMTRSQINICLANVTMRELVQEIDLLTSLIRGVVEPRSASIACRALT